MGDWEFVVGKPDMPASVITTLKAFFKINPFGPMQDDLRAAYQPTLYYNAHRKKGSAIKVPGDLFPSLAPAPKTPEEQAEAIAAMCERIGAMYADGTPGA